jgi:hypothetical protein
VQSANLVVIAMGFWDLVRVRLGADSLLVGC